MTHIEVLSYDLAIVTELPHKPITNQLNNVAEELVRLKFSGKVLFDLAISKGLRNRFFEAFFDGRTLVRTSIHPKENEEIPFDVISHQKIFFRKNNGLLKVSVLSSLEIHDLLDY
jgi:hypothetical protein